MKKSSVNKRIFSIFVLATMFFCAPAFAQEFFADMSVTPGSVRLVGDVLKGESVRIYVTVQNNSYFDLSGVVKFYDERRGRFIGTDQPVSILSQSTDDVFVDWGDASTGDNHVAVRVIPWQADGDNPNNNKVTKNLYVDVDSDGDGVGNYNDPDDDNDGVRDSDDAFPRNSRETKDTDGDGIGDNADPDDDNDGVSDSKDEFPEDPNESRDSDRDGYGDNADPFPDDPNEWEDTDGDGVGNNADPNDENHAPIPNIYTESTIVKADEPVSFSAIKSSDPDGRIVKYEWTFGNGGNDDGSIVSYKFKKTGTHTVTLKVTDDLDESNSAQIEITVQHNIFFLFFVGFGILLILLLLFALIPKRERRYVSEYDTQPVRKPSPSNSDWETHHID